MVQVMKNLSLLILLVLVVTGCSHRQFQSYLLNKDNEKQETVNNKPVPEDQRKIILTVSNDFVKVKKVYSLNLLNEGNVSMLERAKKDLEAFYLIAKNLRANSKTDDLKMFEGHAREYIDEGIDTLLKRDITGVSDEVKKILFKLQYLKALLLYELNDIVLACETIKSLDERFSQNMNVDSDFVVSELRKTGQYMVLTDFKYMCSENIIKMVEH